MTKPATSSADSLRHALHGPTRVPLLCLATFLAVWVLLGVNPRYRDAWLLENLLVVTFVPALVLTFRKFQFTNRAYVEMTVFMLLHAIGSHYTYSEVPAGDWAAEAFGLSRNHYDRLVHFAFGALFVRPLRELTLRNVRGIGPIAYYWLSLAGIAAVSTGYELLEWCVAIIVDPEAGTAFLGTQGDVWDAQKDTALACGGAILALLIDRSPEAESHE